MHSLSLDISERLSINRQKKGSDHFRLDDKQWTGISLISFIIEFPMGKSLFSLAIPKVRHARLRFHHENCDSRNNPYLHSIFDSNFMFLDHGLKL